VANANPAVSLNAVTSAGAGTSVDLAGAATGVAIPTSISMVVTVTGYTASWDKVSAPPFAQIGLEVSLDSTNWVRLGALQASGNGQSSLVKSFPARYARGNLDQLDTRISAITVTAWVAGGQ
jgi:hypothetical protein